MSHDFILAHPEIQELARQWGSSSEPLSEAGFRPLFPLVEKILKTAFTVEGESIDGRMTLIPLLQSCCSNRLRYFNLVFMCCDARGRQWISHMRAAVIHADYSHDMTALREGGWTGTEADYQKVMPNRLHSLFYALNYIVQQIDPQTGRFSRKWDSGRALCASCKTNGINV